MKTKRLKEIEPRERPTVHCLNCINFKTRLITKRMIKDALRMKSRVALEDEGDRLGFPLNYIVARNVKKDGQARIYYCSKGMMRRNVYVCKDDKRLSTFCPENPHYCQCYK